MVPVYFYLPNLIGYARLGLLLAVWRNLSLAHSYEYRNNDNNSNEWAVEVNNDLVYEAVAIYLVFSLLDLLDGLSARKLNQQSKFGGFLDVLIDNFGRSCIWSFAAPNWGWIVISCEWLVLCATQSWNTTEWKTALAEMHGSPWWVNAIMRNNFKTPLGVLVTTGLFGTPVWILLNNTRTKWLSTCTSMSAIDVYGMHVEMELVEYLIGGIIVTGRILAACVEFHVLRLHFLGLARMHNNE